MNLDLSGFSSAEKNIEQIKSFVLSDKIGDNLVSKHQFFWW